MIMKWRLIPIARLGGGGVRVELVPGNPRTVVERGGEFVLDGALRSGARAASEVLAAHRT